MFELYWSDQKLGSYDLKGLYRGKRTPISLHWNTTEEASQYASCGTLIGITKDNRILHLGHAYVREVQLGTLL